MPDHGCNLELRDKLLDMALDHCPEAEGAAAALLTAGFVAISAVVGRPQAASILAKIYASGSSPAPSQKPTALDKWAEFQRLATLRADMDTGMAKLEEIPERAEYAYKRMREADIPAKRRLPLDHPDYMSAGAMFRLTMAYGELWDSLNGRAESC